MKSGLLIYGAYGYSGQLIAEHAIKCGLRPVLAGRNEQKLKKLGDRLQLTFRVFDLTDKHIIIDQLTDIKLVIHCAGPFITTAGIMAEACIKSKTHYLDITGEYEVFEQLFRLDAAAQQAGVLLMPGVGFDVVPTDCLALYLKEKLPAAVSLEIALLLKNGMLSGGTALTIIENMTEGSTVRRNGNLVRSKIGEINRRINFGDSSMPAMAISWGDISTAYRSTAIPYIAVYLCVPQALITVLNVVNQWNLAPDLSIIKQVLSKLVSLLPSGPGAERRKRSGSIVWGEARTPSGETLRAIITLPESYTLTAWTSISIAQKILSTSPLCGTITPAQYFGSDFILQFDGVTRKVIS